MKAYIDNFIEEEALKYQAKNANKLLFKKVLNAISQSLYEYKISTDEFLSEIVKHLERSTNRHWRITQTNRIASKCIENTAPALGPDGSGQVWYTEESDTITAKSIVCDDFSHLFAENKNTKNTSEKPINEDAYESISINALSQMINDSWYNLYKSYFIEFFEKDKLKIEKDIYDKLLREFLSMCKDKEKNLKLIDSINKKITKCNSQIDDCVSEQEFKKHDSSFNSKEYAKCQKLPTASNVGYYVDFFNDLPSVDDSKLQLEEDENGIRNGYNVCASWTWCDDFDDIVENVFVKAPEEMLKILEMMTNLFNSITVKYEIIGKPKHYDKAHYNSKFNHEYFNKEQGIRISLLQGDKKLSIPYVKEEISKIQALAKQLRSKNITSIDIDDVYDKIKFKDEDFVSADESRKLFLENGWVEGERSNWLGDIINGFLDSVEEYVGALSDVITKSEENKIRIKTLNDRAEFYDKLYKNYGRKVKLIDKVKRLEYNKKLAIKKQDFLEELETALIKNGFLSTNSDNVQEKYTDENNIRSTQLVKKPKNNNKGNN